LRRRRIFTVQDLDGIAREIRLALTALADEAVHAEANKTP
jgi:hypothetical protein